METIKNKLEFIKAVAIVTYKEWSAYRTHSLVSVLVGPTYLLVQILIWTAVYSSQPVINGLNLNQMLTYYGISTLIVYLTMDFADWNLQMLIHTGKYVTFALRPMHHRFFALSQKIGHRTLGFVFEFLPVLCIFIFIFRVNLVPASFLWAFLSIALSFLMTFYINYSIGITGFWLTKTNGLRSVVRLLTSVCSGALLPLSFFPDAVQKLVFHLPFQYMTYVPSMVYTGTYHLAGMVYSMEQIVGLQALYVVGMMLVSEGLYRLGTRHFTGVGI